jgi:hemoglobin/transferrin/lactoferrin receptor protein
LGEIVVVATRTPQEKSKTAASVSTYSAQDILNNNISSPQELIQNDVGVSAARSVGGGGMTLLTTTGVEDYNIRGLDENRVLLIEDGIRANDIFSFQGNEAQGRDFYDFDALKNVEIIKSAASALYGGGAIGGVVSYTTKDPSDYLSLTKNPWYAGYKESFDPPRWAADQHFCRSGHGRSCRCQSAGLEPEQLSREDRLSSRRPESAPPDGGVLQLPRQLGSD